MTEFPLLFREDTRERFSIPRDGKPLLVGRGNEAHCQVADQSCSRRQFEVRRVAADVWLEPLSANAATRLNGEECRQPTRLAHGDRISIATARFRYLARPLARDTGDEGRSRSSTDSRGRRIPLRSEIILGRVEDAGVALDHPSVSRFHAGITVSGGRVVLRDLRSKNGTFVNGVLLGGARALCPGDQIDIGPFTLEFDGSELLQRSRVGNLRIVARGLGRSVSLGIGRHLKILNGVSLVVEPRELVCLLGPSGSGKTTLMNALSAREPADEGRVFVSGIELYRNFESLKQGMGVVPQHDVLHEELSLRRALRYTARLRLPSDLSRTEIDERVDAVLESVDLLPHADKRIGRLSGGQKKRASIANEAIASPDVLFLDEVTSGLDEHTDREMMRLFRREADAGTTLVCVTHTLANVEEFCHRIVIMAPPGFLAFAGSPSEALAYFGVERLADVYQRLTEKDGADWARAFSEARDWERAVEQRLASERRNARREPAASRAGEGLLRRVSRFARQTPLLHGRYARLVSSDPKTLIVALGQSVFIALALILVVGGGAARETFERPLLFMLGISCLWFGCNNASKEVVKERHIYRRERDVNLSVTGYLLSKLLVLLGLGAVQAALLFSLVHVGVGVPGPLPTQMGLLLLAVLAGTCLGLWISCASTSEDRATTLVPIALIPQIILSGAIFPYETMPELGRLAARTLIVGHWVERGPLLALEEGAAEAALPALAVSGHALAYLVAAFAVLLLRDARGQRGALRGLLRGRR